MKKETLKEELLRVFFKEKVEIIWVIIMFVLGFLVGKIW